MRQVNRLGCNFLITIIPRYVDVTVTDVTVVVMRQITRLSFNFLIIIN